MSSKQNGLTLIEVLIAVIIMALIGTISYQSLDTTIRSKEVVEEHLKELSKVDRAWLLIEGDLKNILNNSVSQSFGPGGGEDLPSLFLDNSDEEYWLVVLRGGHANPLNFIRSELIRVGYRVQDSVLWRDVWYNVASVDVDQARNQKVLDNVETVEVKILSPTATSFDGGPWVDKWPPQGARPEEMPFAVEVILRLKDDEEISRLFSLVNGK
ncbi:MAG: type II secretion system minor pseudopilin GspJ [Agarilytica sp.]